MSEKLLLAKKSIPMAKISDESNRRCTTIPLILSVFLLGLTQFTQFSQALSNPTRLSPISGPISNAMGGSGLASTEQSEAGFVNPAGLSRAKDASFNFLYQNGFESGDVLNRFFAVAMVDSTTIPDWPTFFSYAKRTVREEGFKKIEGDYFNLSFGYRLFERVNFGLSVLYSEFEELGNNDHEWNGSVGFQYSPLNALIIGLKYAHIVDVPSDYDESLRLPPEVGLGLEYTIRSSLRLRAEAVRADHLNPDKKWIVKGGFEAPIGDFMKYRMGFKSDPTTNEDALTAGLAFDGPQFKIDYYFLEQQRKDGKTTHGIDLRIPF